MSQTQRALQEKISSIRQQIMELSQRLRRAMHPTLSKEWTQIDLTMPQLKVILILDTLGPMAMSRLATLLAVATPTATGIIDRLEERSLVVRENDPSDRRVVNCALSLQGRELVSRFWEQGQWEIENLINSLSIEEMEIVAEALSILCRAAQMNSSEPDIPCESSP